MTEFRPRRSVLYMPSSNERALEKAKTLAVDALILDLEDAVAPDAKAEGRRNAAAAVASGEYGSKELTIRINGADTEWHLDDLKAAAEPRLKAHHLCGHLAGGVRGRWCEGVGLSHGKVPRPDATVDLGRADE